MRAGRHAGEPDDGSHSYIPCVRAAGVGADRPVSGIGGESIPTVSQATHDSGITFCLLAVVQVFSYPFHDPVLTDRGFLNRPAQALRSFLLAAVLSGAFIFLFSIIGLYGLAFGLDKPSSVTVPGAFGLAMLMVFNAIMLMTGGSTIDSTLTSIAKLTGRDWRNDVLDAVPTQVTTGRLAMVVVAVVGNLPLLTIYLGDKVGPAIIAATTISGTMVMDWLDLPAVLVAASRVRKLSYGVLAGCCDRRDPSHRNVWAHEDFSGCGQTWDGTVRAGSRGERVGSWSLHGGVRGGGIAGAAIGG